MLISLSAYVCLHVCDTQRTTRNHYSGLDNSKLTGWMPSSFGSLSALSSLMLSEAQLTGFIPSSFCSLASHLTFCDISTNSFWCPVPSCLGEACGRAQCTVFSGEWSAWSECAVPCLDAGANESQTYYSRRDFNYDDAVQSPPAPWPTETRNCSEILPPCGPGDCWGGWTMWGACQIGECAGGAWRNASGAKERTYIVDASMATYEACDEVDGEVESEECTLSALELAGAEAICSQMLTTPGPQSSTATGVTDTTIPETTSTTSASPSTVNPKKEFSSSSTTTTTTTTTAAATTNDTALFGGGAGDGATEPFGDDTLAVRVGISVAIAVVVAGAIAAGIIIARRKRLLRKILRSSLDSPKKGHKFLQLQDMGDAEAGNAAGMRKRRPKHGSNKVSAVSLGKSNGADGGDDALLAAAADVQNLLHKAAPASAAEATEVPGNADADADEESQQIGHLSSWTQVEKLVASVAELGTAVSAAEDAADSAEEAAKAQKARAVHRRALLLLRATLDENQQLLQDAIARKDYDQMTFYAVRVKLLEQAVPKNLANASGSASSGNRGGNARNGTLECVAPGLLLYKDRFDGHSQAFLGRGGSAAVSRGVLVEVIGGRKEVRTTVAVKEVPKTGAQSEQQAMRELLLLKKKLRTPHPNIIQMHGIKATGSTFYVIMQYCSFSLDKQPEAFVQYLHDYRAATKAATSRGSGGAVASSLVAPSSSELSTGTSLLDGQGDGGGDNDQDAAFAPLGSPAPSPSPSSSSSKRNSRRRRGSTNNFTGALLLNALVQDLLRAVGLLHSKHIMHCDIKVRFLRAACPLLRFVSWLNDPHRVCACAVIFSHAAWQLADIVQPFRKAPRVLPESIPLSTVSSSRCVSPHLTVKRSNRDNDVLFFRNLL